MRLMEREHVQGRRFKFGFRWKKRTKKKLGEIFFIKTINFKNTKYQFFRYCFSILGNLQKYFK